MINHTDSQHDIDPATDAAGPPDYFEAVIDGIGIGVVRTFYVAMFLLSLVGLSSLWPDGQILATAVAVLSLDTIGWAASGIGVASIAINIAAGITNVRRMQRIRGGADR